MVSQTQTAPASGVQITSDSGTGPVTTVAPESVVPPASLRSSQPSLSKLGQIQAPINGGEDEEQLHESGCVRHKPDTAFTHSLTACHKHVSHCSVSLTGNSPHLKHF